MEFPGSSSQEENCFSIHIQAKQELVDMHGHAMMRSYSMRSHPTRAASCFALSEQTNSFTNRQKDCQSQEYGQCSYSSVPMIFSGFGKVRLSHDPDDRPPSAVMLAMIIHRGCDCSHFRPVLRRGGQSSSQSWMPMTFPLTT
jgi:hypothetical protein